MRGGFVVFGLFSVFLASNLGGGGKGKVVFFPPRLPFSIPLLAFPSFPS